MDIGRPRYGKGTRVLCGGRPAVVVKPVYNQGRGWLYDVLVDGAAHPTWNVEDMALELEAPSPAHAAWWGLVQLAAAVPSVLARERDSS